MHESEQVYIRKSIKTNRSIVLASVLLAIFIAAIEGTIVATAIPSIVGDLGGFSLFSWVFSSFLLAQAVTIPIYGKLADLFGRKPVFTFGIIVFLIGSVLCGFAKTMNMLIIYRLLQGIGAGAVQPIATTIIGDIFSLSERARIQGYISSVWGVSSIIGPALGAFFVQYVHWAWIFWVNVPIGMLAVAGIWFFLGEAVHKQQHTIDYIGSGLIFISVSALMIVFIQAGTVWAWSSVPVLLLLGLSFVGFYLFILQEKHTAEPIMPLEIWTDSLLVVSNLATLTTGIVIIGISSFLPTYIQGVMGKSPIISGFVLAFMTMGWVMGASIAGKIMFKFGFRRIAIIGGFWILAGSMFLITMAPERGWLWAGVGSLLIGIGMGFARTVFIVGIQDSVEWQMRGVATASNMFMNILGNTMGAALLGGVLNTKLTSYLKGVSGEAFSVDVVNVLLDPVKRGTLPNGVIDLMTSGLTISLHYVFYGVCIVSGLSFILVLFFPNKTRDAL
ncbi:MDR family MFS transporter [Desulfosporosinus nitroreducens]|uniref:MFS transporter n=1 Tax=Desulfosporosinus nitroreducens TaxID=2018668 RepID=A0ABT8QW57_9FIRM|nr:MDR family MFS transporter [Desulfosporosinus nitroreducens]MCO1600832.1 MFS transporter [Desulfosporosinus nitroreducens]MDO0825561.1 MFS transporter [Desulfosporosinus nitroreducens]